jgi:hypothetical protein
MSKCKCEFCTTYEFYKWAVIMECGCGCHNGDGMTGHDGLCCEFPNGLKKNNPHKELKPLKYYKDILDKWEREANDVKYETAD